MNSLEADKSRISDFAFRKIRNRRSDLFYMSTLPKDVQRRNLYCEAFI